MNPKSIVALPFLISDQGVLPCIISECTNFIGAGTPTGRPSPFDEQIPISCVIYARLTVLFEALGYFVSTFYISVSKCLMAFISEVPQLLFERLAMCHPNKQAQARGNKKLFHM